MSGGVPIPGFEWRNPLKPEPAGKVLPLEIVDQPGGAVIRCKCGRELAQVRRRSAVARIAAPRHGSYDAPAVIGLAPDITAAGLAVMVAHAKQCRDVRR